MKTYQGTKLCSYFYSLYRISRPEFYEWLFGPEKLLGLSRNGPQVFHDNSCNIFSSGSFPILNFVTNWLVLNVPRILQNQNRWLLHCFYFSVTLLQYCTCNCTFVTLVILHQVHSSVLISKEVDWLMNTMIFLFYNLKQ